MKSILLFKKLLELVEMKKWLAKGAYKIKGVNLLLFNSRFLCCPQKFMLMHFLRNLNENNLHK